MCEHLIVRQVEPFSSFVKANVPDPRKTRGRKYDLEILIDLIIIGLIAGKTDLVAISNFIKENFDEFSALLNLEHPPSHDCLNDLVNSINPEYLEQAFEEWVLTFYKHDGMYQLSGDGTFATASTDKIRKGKEPNIINFVSPETRLVIAIHLVMGKGANETEGFKKILERLDIKDMLITADALNCTLWIMEYIVEEEGYFLFPVKEDKRKLKKRIIETLAEDLENVDVYHQGVVAEHGILVDRFVYISNDVDKLKMKRTYPFLKQFGLIESTRMKYFYNEEGERVITKTSYQCYGIISNFCCSAEEAGTIKRDEWSVETFHNRKDDFFNEDHTTYKKEEGVLTMAILRRVAYNLLILSENIISNFNKHTLSEKSIFFEAHKDLLTMLVTGYNPDYPFLMEKFHEKKAQSYRELGCHLSRDSQLPLEFISLTDLLDF